MLIDGVVADANVLLSAVVGDSEDAQALALARLLAPPIWSNDKNFKHVEVPCFSTARLLGAHTKR